MKVQILLSPSASGKTRTCVQTVREVLTRQPLAPVWVVVGDHRQAAHFRRRLAATGGALGARIVTFADLYLEILEIAGRRIPIVPAAMAHQLVQTAISRAELEYFAGLRGLPGFTLTLETALAEFKRSGVAPDRLSELTGQGGRSTQELRRIYQEYQTLLEWIGWTDPDGTAELALKALEDEPRLMGGCALLVVDGFDGFTTIQRRALRLLAQCSHRTLITLPGETSWGRPVHRGFQPALGDLQQDLDPEI
ncbi:MAG: hypothetical protein M1281_08110, partial [Chloroflexi bacterium]|nr:hypothetical protein [Chloroflexota bacterium]